MKRKIFFAFCLLFISIGVITAQNTRITGTVVDANGDPLIGASVVVKGTTVGNVTNFDGQFSIDLPKGKDLLVFSLVGMKAQELKAANGMKVVLEDNVTELSEAIVVAYGTVKKEALTGSVSAISAKDIDKRPLSNAVAALEGTTTGLQVNSSYGEPGSSPGIRIRGFSSISGSNDPLYIVDGVPYGGNINDINPGDIENISVLKDAASAALYGSRATNGVILITTKSGGTGKGELRININQGIYQRSLPIYDRIGSNDFMELYWTGYKNSLITNSKGGLSQEAAAQKANETLISDILRYNIYNVDSKELFDANGKLSSGARIHPLIEGDLDWFKPMERIGYRQDYNLSGNIGVDKLKAFYSASYLNEEGYLKNSGFNRFSGRTNITYSPKKWLNVGFSMSGTHQKTSYANGEGSGYTNVFSQATGMAPIYPVHLFDLSTGEYILDEKNQIQYDRGGLYSRPQSLDRHTVWENELNISETYKNTMASLLSVDVLFPQNFKFTIKGNLDNRNSEQSEYTNAIIGDGAGSNGKSKRIEYRYKEYYTLQQLSWNKSFGNHNVDAIAGHEFFSFTYNYLYANKDNQIFTGNTALINFSNTTSLYGYDRNHKIESYLSRARYNYDEKYFIEASYRRDGNSKFHPSHRWGSFWSLGGTWSIFRESFIADIDWINYLKVRASYGQVGNDGGSDIGYEPYMSLYYIDKNAGLGAVYRSQDADPSVSWESNNSFNVGVEGQIFSRLKFTAEYYNKQSEGLLLDVSRPLSVGSANDKISRATVVQNIGSMSNKGVELSLSGDIISTKDLTWSMGVDIAFLKNEITKLADENKKDGVVTDTKKWMEGKSLYEYWLYQWVGIDQTDGSGLYIFDEETHGETAAAKPYIREINGAKYTSRATYAKKDFSGSAIPKAYGSVNTSLAFKNFNLSALFTYSIGGKMLDYSYASLMSVSTTPKSNHVDILNAWKGVPEGMTNDSPDRIDPNGTPVVDYTLSSYYHSSISTRFLVDRSYFSIKNISLVYNVPRSFTSKIGFSDLTIGTNMENIAIFTKRKGMNPQESFGGDTDSRYAPSRVLSLSLNIKL